MEVLLCGVVPNKFNIIEKGLLSGKCSLDYAGCEVLYCSYNWELVSYFSQTVYLASIINNFHLSLLKTISIGQMSLPIS